MLMGNLIRSRVKWISQEGKSTNYLLNLENFTYDEIPKLNRTENYKQTEIEKKISTKYYTLHNL